MKSNKMISLSTEVIVHIKKNIRSHHFNFSEWVENEYKNKFMNVDSKLEKIKELQESIDNLNREIVEINERKEAIKSNLSRNEINFLKTIPILISGGAEWLNLTNRYNVMFNKKYIVEELKEMTRFIEEKHAKPRTV